MKIRSVWALSLISALAITALVPLGAGAEKPASVAVASQEAGEDTTPPKVRNRKLNAPEVTDLLEGSVLRLRLTANEPCIIRTQLVYKGDVLGKSTREVLAKGGTRVAKLGLSRKGRAIVMRKHPKKVRVGIQATDRVGNRAQTRAYQD